MPQREWLVPLKPINYFSLNLHKLNLKPRISFMKLCCLNVMFRFLFGFQRNAFKINTLCWAEIYCREQSLLFSSNSLVSVTYSLIIEISCVFLNHVLWSKTFLKKLWMNFWAAQIFCLVFVLIVSCVTLTSKTQLSEGTSFSRNTQYWSSQKKETHISICMTLMNIALLC